MGTRALVRVFDDGQEILCLYRQFDGYPTSLGRKVRDFVASKRLTNGISGDPTGTANGMGCLAAQLVEHLKAGKVGNVYLYPPGCKDMGEEYEYHVRDPAAGGPNRAHTAKVLGFESTSKGLRPLKPAEYDE